MFDNLEASLLYDPEDWALYEESAWGSQITAAKELLVS